MFFKKILVFTVNTKILRAIKVNLHDKSDLRTNFVTINHTITESNSRDNTLCTLNDTYQLCGFFSPVHLDSTDVCTTKNYVSFP